MLAIGAGGGCLDIFSLVYHFSFFSPSLWEKARYKLKYCLKGPKTTNQPSAHDVFKTRLLANGIEHIKMKNILCSASGLF